VSPDPLRVQEHAHAGQRIIAQFENQDATGGQELFRLHRHRLIDLKTLLAGKQGLLGFMLADFAGQLLGCVAADIGRIADNQIERSAKGRGGWGKKSLQEIALHEVDAGADGVIVPQISTREEIDRLVQTLRYPPEGQRSFGVAAAHQYGRVFEAYVKSANESLTLIVQVETMAGVERIDSIVSHPAVDGAMIGPYDLSGSLGIPGALTHPRVVEASKLVIKACTASSRSCGVHLVHPTLEEVRQHLAAGFTFLVLGSDVFNLWKRSVEVDAMIDLGEGSDNA